MLKKTRSAEGMARVTFVLPSQPNAGHIHVAGDFNGWQVATPMKRQKDGSWRATVELEPGREYQFRYLVDGNVWVNDESADAYVPNGFGADNCVVRTPEAGVPATAARRSGAGRSPATGTHDSPREGRSGARDGKGSGNGRAPSGRGKPREE